MNISGYAGDHFTMIHVGLIFLAILVVSRNYIYFILLALSLVVVTLHREMTKKILAPLSEGILTTRILEITAYDIFIEKAGRKNAEGLIYEEINV